MKNIKNKKNFTLLIVAVLILGLSLSCKSNEEPEIEIPTLYHGTWVYTDDTNTTALDIKSNKVLDLLYFRLAMIMEQNLICS